MQPKGANAHKRTPYLRTPLRRELRAQDALTKLYEANGSVMMVLRPASYRHMAVMSGSYILQVPDIDSEGQKVIILKKAYVSTNPSTDRRKTWNT